MRVQVTIIEPGSFVTKGVTENAVLLPYHPAYTNPKSGSHATRAFFESAATGGADPEKAAQRFYELAHLSNPPLRFSIGKDSIASAREQLKQVAADIDGYETWSEGINFP